MEQGLKLRRQMAGPALRAEHQALCGLIGLWHLPQPISPQTAQPPWAITHLQRPIQQRTIAHAEGADPSALIGPTNGVVQPCNLPELRSIQCQPALEKRASGFAMTHMQVKLHRPDLPSTALTRKEILSAGTTQAHAHLLSRLSWSNTDQIAHATGQHARSQNPSL